MSEERVSWKDSNLALIGSKLDHQVKEAAAALEDAWDGIGLEVATKIWRVEQFQIVAWPEEKYGMFHTGDSYIVLNTYQTSEDEPKLLHDVHIWIGKESSQDEYGTAAYKMVECDDSLHGLPVEHREVQGFESSLFLSYFTKPITYLLGGVETGFNHVEPTIADPNLYRVRKTHKDVMTLTQMSLEKNSLNQGDSFILYNGEDKVWVWHGASAAGMEKFKANTTAESMATGCTVSTLESDDTDDDFWAFFGEGDIQDALEDETVTLTQFAPVLYKLPGGEGGDPEEMFTSENEISSGEPCFDKSLLNDDDVFLVDVGWELFIWIGTGADKSEKIHGVAKGQNYAKADARTMSLPMTLVKSGQESAAFDAYFS